MQRYEDIDIEELAADLEDDFAPQVKVEGPSPRAQRIVHEFMEVQRFHAKYGRLPQFGSEYDLFERRQAVRWQCLRNVQECRALIAPLDTHGWLEMSDAPQYAHDSSAPALQISEPETDIRVLRHVRSSTQRRAVGEVAQRQICKDFPQFAPLFAQVQRDIKSGKRSISRFNRDPSIKQGQFFILGGLTAYIAEVGETIKAPNGDDDARLRVIFSNGTQSRMLMRSLQSSLYKDESGQRISEAVDSSLFATTRSDEDISSGTIYVLRSHSQHPFVVEHRELLHKIGVTGGKLETRLANAAHESTYLLAEVEVVATYTLVGIQRVKLEKLLHRIFAAAQVDITIQDRFGHPVQPREWFLVPLAIIGEAVQRIQDGSIINMIYDPQRVQLVSD